MSRSLSTAMLNSVNAAQTADVYIILLTISHPSLTPSICVTSDAVETVSNGQTFLPFPFKINLPDDMDNSSPKAKLSIDNTDRSIVQAVRSINSAPTVTIQIIRAADPDTIEIEFDDFKLTSVTYDANVVQGDLTVEDFTTEPFPADSFSPSLFPGLF